MFCWKPSFCSVFSATQLCGNKRVWLEKNKKYQKLGGVCQHAKRSFFVSFFVVSWFCFSLCFYFLVVWKKKLKGYFPAILDSFFCFCVPERPVFKILIFFLFCSLFWFSFCLPFQNSIFCLLSINLIWKTWICLVYVSLFFLHFPFLMLACLFQTNFPNTPFLKPKLLSFLVVYVFLLLFLFLFSCFMFLPFCLMLALFLVCFVLFLSCFCFVSCFAFTDYEKLFPCNSSVFSHVGYKVVLYFFAVSCFGSCLFFLVLFVSILDIWFVLLCVCVVWLSSFF